MQNDLCCNFFDVDFYFDWPKHEKKPQSTLTVARNEKKSTESNVQRITIIANHASVLKGSGNRTGACDDGG